jgi:hypothetical protein
MVTMSFSLKEDYWATFKLEPEDIEYLYNYLLESETPMTSQELVKTLVAERIQREKTTLEEQRLSGGEIYYPKEQYAVGNILVFPALGWRRGKVIDARPGHNPDAGDFEVIEIDFDDGETHEYAGNLLEHVLNNPPDVSEDDDSLNPNFVLQSYDGQIIASIEVGLEEHEDFVRIAGRWFPRALLVDVNIGHLNLAEAVLDLNNGGPLPTSALIEQVELTSNVNAKLLEFSMDLALQEDERFDEVGPAGEVLWFLRRLEPAEVLKTPSFLLYHEVDYDPSALSNQMLALIEELDDELSISTQKDKNPAEVEVRLIYPHWRAGTLPLSPRISHLFPTAYEAPRIRVTFVDGDNGQRFPAWVLRNRHYVYGLKEWYESAELIPGSVIRVRQGQDPGDVIIFSDSQRTTREWVRTVLVGSDGGLVFAMLKQIVPVNFDDRMVVAVPDPDSIDLAWAKIAKERPAFEQIVVNTVKELAKLNPQAHVHATELYAAINIIRRCPPEPILALLASRPWFDHVGDLHFRFIDAEAN